MPTLSVCVFSNESPARLAAVVAPLHDIAHEIVVVLDDQVEDPDLTPLTEVATTVLIRPFTWPLEANLEWLHGLCTGDWILRLDGDETVSQDLLDVLAGDSWHQDVTHCYLPRRWLVDGGTAWIKANPWWPDTQLRLIKNDPESIHAGVNVHETVVVEGPARVLSAPIYHLDLINTAIPERRSKALAYLRARPDLRTHGGLAMSAFYTPETVQPRPATEPLPAEDHAFVHSVTTSDHLAIGRQQPIKRPPLDEVPGRSVSIDVIHVDYSGYVTEYLEVLVTVANTGSEPIDPGGDFPARVAAQWSTELGESVLVEGRADFLGPLKPGAAETTLMLLPIPDTEGEYVLSIGLVEEGRQWLGRAPEISFSAVTQPRVTIAGGYSRHRHLGDDLVTRSLIEEIQGAFPQVKISLLSDRPEPVGDRFGVTAVEDAVTIYKHDTDEGVSPTSAIASIVSLAREHLDGTRIADARIAALTDHVAGSDLLVIAAAGSLASEFADAILWPRLIETEIADAAGVPIVVTSAGVGPFTSDEHIAAAKRLLDMARDVHARDRQTLSLLEEVGVDGPVTTFVPDAAMGIGAAQAHDIERFLTEVGLVDETFVVASARPGDTIETVEQIARAADSAASEQDAVVVLLPHCTSEWIDDRPALERLEGLLGSVRAVVMIDAMPPDPIAADLIRLAASTVGTRFHNAVLSASVGRPTILITQSEYDQHRAAGFAGLSGVAVSVITPSTRLTARRIRAALRQKPATPRYPKPHPVVTVMHALGIGRR